MNSSLRKLRTKYIVTASIIVFCVIMVMVFILNLLMRITYKNEENMIQNVIEQAAITHMNEPITEYFDLKEAPQTEGGDYIIPRSPRDISYVTMYGNISINDKSAIWYSAGGGLLFEAETENGREMVYKDYTFNKDTTNVSIDFSSFDNLKSGLVTLSIDESQIISDYFLVSVVWWKNSSIVPDGMDEGITLTLDSIEIHYKDSHSFPEASNQLVSHNSFSDIFEKNIPAILDNAGAFYLITDKKNQLVSVNNGNLMKTVENNEARDYAERVLESGRDSGKIKMDSSVYCYIVRELDEMNLIIFVNDSFTHTANSNLLKISLLVGFAVWIFLLILIIIVSGYVVKPVAENMERQKQFISNASHELKTPVTVISATIDIISSKKGSDRWTECIKEQTKKMQSLITELLDLSKLIENPDNRTGFEVCDISSAVSNSLLYFESLLFESGKTLNRDIDDNVLLKCDENKISQLTGILMDNALKYSDEKSEISFSLHREKDNAVMRCTNLCSDFSAKNTSRLFERFYRSDNDHSHEQEGFGLGLSIAQAITELHRGSIKADYNDNTVTFTITLPIH